MYQIKQKNSRKTYGQLEEQHLFTKETQFLPQTQIF